MLSKEIHKMDNELMKIDKTGDITTVEFLKDEISIVENENVKRELLNLIKKGNKKILVNFSKVQFISSVILASLISCLKEMKEVSGVLKLCCMNQKVKSVFYVTELYKIFEIYEDKAHALDAFPRHAL